MRLFVFVFQPQPQVNFHRNYFELNKLFSKQIGKLLWKTTKESNVCTMQTKTLAFDERVWSHIIASSVSMEFSTILSNAHADN